MVAKNEIKPIYSNDHYRMKMLIGSPKFQSRLQAALESWSTWDIPIPEKGFARAKDYYTWITKLKAACNKAMGGEEVAHAIEQINNDATISATEKMRRRLEAWKSLLPPVPHGVIDRLLKESNLDPKNKEYRLFLTKYIFFGQKEFSKPFFSVQGKRNEKTDEMEIFLKLEPHTKKEHIMTLWGRVEDHLKLLPDYVGKNKPWEEFERDLEVFNTYQEIESTMVGKRVSHQSGNVGLDTKTWQTLREHNKGKYRRLTLSQVRKSVARIKDLNKIDHVKG